MLIGLISETFIRIGVWLVAGVYKIAAFVFKLFLILASGNLLDVKDYKVMIENSYIILGVVLLFMLAFALLRAMVNPENEKQGTTVVKKVIINLVSSGVMIALLPTIFGLMYDFQNSILSRNVIGKFFGYGSYSNSGPDYQTNFEMIESGAYAMANGVFTAFFNVNDDTCSSIDSELSLYECQATVKSDWKLWKLSRTRFECTITDDHDSFLCAIDEVEHMGTFGMYTHFADAVDDGEIDFHFILSLVAAALLCYIGVSFCFDMAIRLVKLVFYQIIAPIPIFLRVPPNDKWNGVFNNWLKITLTCYMEVYVRIFIFYFGIFLCKSLIDSTFIANAVSNYGLLLGLLAKAFVLMGIVTFMKQAPGLLSKVFGFDSGGMKLGIREKLKDGGFYKAASVTSNLALSGFRMGRKIMKDPNMKRPARILGALGRTVSTSVRAGIKSDAKSLKDVKKGAINVAETVQKKQSVADSYYLAGNKTISGAMRAKNQDRKDSFMEFLTGEEQSAYKLSQSFSEGIGKVSNIKSSSNKNLDKFKTLSANAARKKYGDDFVIKFYGAEFDEVDGKKIVRTDANGNVVINDDRVLEDERTGKKYYGLSKLVREKQEIDILSQAISQLTNESGKPLSQGELLTKIQGSIKTMTVGDNKDRAQFLAAYNAFTRDKKSISVEEIEQIRVDSGKLTGRKKYNDELEKIQNRLQNGEISDTVALEMINNLTSKWFEKEKQVVKLQAVEQGLVSGEIDTNKAYKELTQTASELTKQLQDRQYTYNTYNNDIEKVYSQYVMDNYESGTVDFQADATDSKLAIEDIRNFIKANYADINYYYLDTIGPDGKHEKHEIKFEEIDGLTYNELSKIKDTMTIVRGETAEKIARAQEREKRKKDAEGK